MAQKYSHLCFSCGLERRYQVRRALLAHDAWLFAATEELSLAVRAGANRAGSYWCLVGNGGRNVMIIEIILVIYSYMDHVFFNDFPRGLIYDHYDLLRINMVHGTNPTDVNIVILLGK